MLQNEYKILTLAETKRFELLKGFTPYLVSSEAHSTGLCDVSSCKDSLHARKTMYLQAKSAYFRAKQG